MLKTLYITYFICAVVLFNVYYSLRTNHVVINPKMMNEEELLRCNKLKPGFYSMLVIEESKIYWKTKNSTVVCVKDRIN